MVDGSWVVTPGDDWPSGQAPVSYSNGKGERAQINVMANASRSAPLARVWPLWPSCPSGAIHAKRGQAQVGQEGRDCHGGRRWRLQEALLADLQRRSLGFSNEGYGSMTERRP